MKITFDPAKRRTTLNERGLDFADSSAVFAGLTLTAEDRRRDYGEVLAGRMVIVVWTKRGTVRRIISMRKANAKEQSRYLPFFETGA